MVFLLMLLTSLDTLTHRIQFSENELSFDMINGNDLVRLEGSLSIQVPGYPSLPRKSILFAIPYGTRIHAIEATVQDSVVLAGCYSIHPSQPPVPISWEDSIPVVPPDSTIYGLSVNWPHGVVQGSRLGAAGITDLARVDVFPLAWNPFTGDLTLRQSIEFDILLVQDSTCLRSSVSMTETSWERRHGMLSPLVANSGSIESYSAPFDTLEENARDRNSFPVALDYLIITPPDDPNSLDSWTEAWESLVEWNIRRGLYTELLTLEEINAEAGSTGRWALGRDWAETIRNCIRWHYVNRGVQYVLLGTEATNYGIGTQPDTEAPMRRCKVYRWPADPQHDFCYTDWYYACLDAAHNWDTNNNEPGGSTTPRTHH